MIVERHTIEPLASVHQGGQHFVSGQVAGDFPGSPSDLRFVFRLEAGKSASPEIH